VYLDDTATLSSGVEGESLRLGSGATSSAATIGLLAGAGAQVQLGADAVMEGDEVRSTSANGSLALNGGGAKLDGMKVDVTAMTVATVVAPMVKIN